MPRNERWEELHEHPDWHFWPTRPAGRPDLDGFPPFDELIDALEAVVVRHPATVFIGAHVGCAAEDLGRVGTILERAPNFHVDIAARIGELGRQPYTARAFIERWADRVAVRHRHGARSRLVRGATTGSSRRATSRSPTTPIPTSRPARAAGGSTASACPTTCCARSTGRTRCASSGSEPWRLRSFDDSGGRGYHSGRSTNLGGAAQARPGFFCSKPTERRYAPRAARTFGGPTRVNSKTTYISKDGLDKLRAELDEMLAVRRPEIAQRIHDAKEHGDLSENAEYEDAKNEQAFVEGRIQTLEALIKNATLIDEHTSTDHVQIGSTVKVKSEDGPETFLIVGLRRGQARPGPDLQRVAGRTRPAGQEEGREGPGQVPAGDFAYTIVEIS